MASPVLPAYLTPFALPGSIAFEASPLGGPVARLTHGRQAALVAIHGGQVLNWTIDGQGLLWLSPVARIRAGKGIRGGIPVCWPWFGDHPRDASKPAHGFVRHRDWRVTGSSSGTDGVTLTVETETGDGDATIWPHRAGLALTITLGDGLALSLTTRNTGGDAVPLTQALHTYFRLSDISHATVDGLDGCAYLDKLDGFARKTQAGPVAVDGEVDRIYVGGTSAITLGDAGSGRRIRIASTGSRSAVVWNPWTAKTARLGDMGSPDAFQQMICVETANAGDDVVTLAPGGVHTLGVSYRLD